MSAVDPPVRLRAVPPGPPEPPRAPGLSVPSLSAVRNWLTHAVGVAVGLPARLELILDEVGDLLALIRGTVRDVDRVLGQVRDTRAGAATVVEAAGATSRAVDDLLALYDRTARDAAPLAARFVDGLSPEAVDTAAVLANRLPLLTERLESEVLPTLRTLEQVAPDLHQLLDLARQGRQAVDGLPGVSTLRRRGAAKEDSADG